MLEGLMTGLIGSLVAVVLLLVAKEVALPAVIQRTELTNDVIGFLEGAARQGWVHMVPP